MDKISEIQYNLKETHDSLHKSTLELMNRGRKLEKLNADSIILNTQSQTFARRSTEPSCLKSIMYSTILLFQCITCGCLCCDLISVFNDDI